MWSTGRARLAAPRGRARRTVVPIAGEGTSLLTPPPRARETAVDVGHEGTAARLRCGPHLELHETDALFAPRGEGGEVNIHNRALEGEATEGEATAVELRNGVSTRASPKDVDEADDVTACPTATLIHGVGAVSRLGTPDGATVVVATPPLAVRPVATRPLPAADAEADGRGLLIWADDLVLVVPRSATPHLGAEVDHPLVVGGFTALLVEDAAQCASSRPAAVLLVEGGVATALHAGIPGPCGVAPPPGAMP